MGFSERVTALRKQAGWSQEELAQRLDVSRQAVSKWESGQAMPDLDRVVRMSELFGVSTDSLLKDTPEPDRSVQEAVRAVTMEEAEAFLSLKETMADRIAWAVLACVLAPIPLLMLSALAEAGRLSENVAGAGAEAAFPRLRGGDSHGSAVAGRTCRALEQRLRRLRRRTHGGGQGQGAKFLLRNHAAAAGVQRLRRGFVLQRKMP